MTDHLPPPAALPPAAFDGPIGEYRRGRAWSGWRKIRGHLTFDSTTLTIRGLRARVDANRHEVRAIRLHTTWGTTFVSILYPDGRESVLYFAAPAWTAIKPALEQRGWPVIEEQGSGRYRSLADSRQQRHEP